MKISKRFFCFVQRIPRRYFLALPNLKIIVRRSCEVLVQDVTTASQIPAADTGPVIMDLDDPILVQVQQLLGLGTSGIILTGVPGTGKSYYANRIAKHLVKEPLSDIFRVQLHPSYGYEDFVEGYRPDENSQSGFKIVDKTFVLACRRARDLKR